MLSAWRFERRGRALDFGRPPEHDLRDIMDAILYVDRTGVQWRYLPHDFPHWNTVYGYFTKWADEGVFTQLNGLLRQLLREKEGRHAEPSACVIDAQSVKTSTSVPATGQGIDAGKKIVGRKRNHRPCHTSVTNYADATGPQSPDLLQLTRQRLVWMPIDGLYNLCHMVPRMRRLPSGVVLPARSGPYADQLSDESYLLRHHHSSGARNRCTTSRRRTCW
ncbi:transposase IS4 family protein [Streptomyces coelicoflavus ZG0656]|nr:transposase IS4 family protein [Streptomyces coelicoflavus ZG0656]